MSFLLLIGKFIKENLVNNNIINWLSLITISLSLIRSLHTVYAANPLIQIYIYGELPRNSKDGSKGTLSKVWPLAEV